MTFYLRLFINKLFKKLLYLSVLAKMLLFNAALADSADVLQQYRLPSEKTIEKIKNNEDFFYREEARGKSLLQMFLDWLGGIFKIKKGSFADDFLKEYIWYILFFAVLAFIIYKLFRSEITGLFYRSGRATKINISELEEDIHEIDFDKLINNSLINRNFRYALRLYYLKTLKLLSERGLIHWEKDKTNNDFLAELSGSELHSPFEQITTQFNQIWYGDFPLDEVAFETAKSEFNNFNDKLKGGSGR